MKHRHYIDKLKNLSLSIPLFIFLAFPASTNYQLKTYEFGGGGTRGLDSTNYSMEGIAGQVSSDRSSSTNYTNMPGLIYAQMANTPGTPTLSNVTGRDYNKLTIIINPTTGNLGNNPTSAKFAVGISTDNFVADTTNFVDPTTGQITATETFDTYSNWGGVSGRIIVGLTANTAYSVKVKATQGKITEGPWGVAATTSTDIVRLTYSLTPNSINMGSLNIGSPTTSGTAISITLDTNAVYGGAVYVYDQYGGLNSTHASKTITSATADLTAASEGFGLYGNSVGQASYGPMAFVYPYTSGAGTTPVGQVSTTIRKIIDSSGTQVQTGTATIDVKAKVSTTTPASTDYTDTLTLIASGMF